MLRGGSLGYSERGCEITLLTMLSFHFQPRGFVFQVLKDREIMVSASQYKDVWYIGGIIYIGVGGNRKEIC